MSEQHNEITKHLKQLQNQNYKLRKLLTTALEVADKDSENFSQLKLESNVLTSELNNLQYEKQQLEDALGSINPDGTENIDQLILILEQEHLELRSKLEEVLNEIRKGYLEIDQLKLEDAELKKTIIKLENEKMTLVNKIKCVEKISEVGSDMKENKPIKRQPKFIKPTGRPTTLVDIIKDRLYDELQETIAKSTEEINHIKVTLSDPDITELIKDIEIQKNILLNNLKLLKLKEEKDTKLDAPTSNSINTLPPLTKPSEVETATIDLAVSCLILDQEKQNDKPSTSFDQTKLDELVSRLENERTFLLKRLHSISETSAQQFEERQLQTQSELHSSFMREISSEEIVDGYNKRYDDATNQLYADEEARLGQRIRELEAENERIKAELDMLTNQMRAEIAIVPPNGISMQLKEKIAEMEEQESIVQKTLPK